MANCTPMVEGEGQHKALTYPHKDKMVHEASNKGRTTALGPEPETESMEVKANVSNLSQKQLVKR